MKAKEVKIDKEVLEALSINESTPAIIELSEIEEFANAVLAIIHNEAYESTEDKLYAIAKLLRDTYEGSKFSISYSEIMKALIETSNHAS